MSNGTFKETFEGANRRRTLIVIGTNMLLHLTGLSFITNYGTIFIQMQDAFNPFLHKDHHLGLDGGGVHSKSVSGGLCWSSVRFSHCNPPRHRQSRSATIPSSHALLPPPSPLMLLGSIWQTLGLFCMGALGTVNNPPLSIRNGIIALMPLFQAGFNIGWGAHMHVVVAEIPTLRLRDKTYAMGAACKYVSFPPLQSLVPIGNGMLTRHPKKTQHRRSVSHLVQRHVPHSRAVCQPRIQGRLRLWRLLLAERLVHVVLHPRVHGQDARGDRPAVHCWGQYTRLQKCLLGRIHGGAAGWL